MNVKAIGTAALVAACVVGCCDKGAQEALVTVNGHTLTRCELDKDVAKLMEARKAQIPAEQMEQTKKMFEERIAQDHQDVVLFFRRGSGTGRIGGAGAFLRRAGRTGRVSIRPRRGDCRRERLHLQGACADQRADGQWRGVCGLERNGGRRIQISRHADG